MVPPMLDVTNVEREESEAEVYTAIPMRVLICSSISGDVDYIFLARWIKLSQLCRLCTLVTASYSIMVIFQCLTRLFTSFAFPSDFCANFSCHTISCPIFGAHFYS